jgi:hypothetical protein
MDEPLVVAVGSLSAPAAAWVGFARDAGGYRLACGDAAGTVRRSESEGETRTDELLLAAIAYYEEALEPPPVAWEATQADLAGLLRWLASIERDAGRRSILARAVDAIDDGLAGDAVAGRLAEARPVRGGVPAGPEEAWGEPDDLAGLLARRCSTS